MVVKSKILRNGNNVSIKKNVIDKIIWKLDTINFTGYICTEKVRPAVRFQDTPEYQLMGIIDNANQLKQNFRAKSKIAFLYAPLQGDYNAEEFAGIQSSVIELFKQIAEIKMITPSEMLTELKSGLHYFDYAFLVRKYDVEILRSPKRNYLEKSLIALSTGEIKSELFTIADFIVFDIQERQIVYRTVLTEKQYVWGGSEYSWSGIFTPDKWQKEMEKKQAERKLNKNGQAIQNQVVNGISTYLGIGWK